MPRARASTVVRGDPDRIFALTNDISRWKDYFHEYTESEVISLERHGRFAIVTFRLTDEARGTWESWRILDYQTRTAIAQRGSPEYPYLFMHLKWTYEVTEGGVLLTCTHDFEMDPAAHYTNEQALERMEKHLNANLAHMKEIVEALLESTHQEGPALSTGAT